MEEITEEVQKKLDQIATERDRKLLEEKKLNRKILIAAIICVVVWGLVLTVVR